MLKPLPLSVKVIRQKELNPEVTNWWSPERAIDKYYSGILNEKQCVYSFTSQLQADKCKKFLLDYKNINKKYPDLYVSKTLKQAFDDSHFDIYVEDESLFLMKRRCLLNNIGLIGITRFDYTFDEIKDNLKNVFTLSISAVDLLENDNFAHKEEYVDNLNFLLDM
jgi:hypothetical protein